MSLIKRKARPLIRANAAAAPERRRVTQTELVIDGD
jgi:hypothetical protein